MTKGRTLLATGIGLFLAATLASAHHSFDTEFDANKPVTLRGTLTRMELTNPHGWIYLDVKGEGGTVVNWRVETGPTNALMRRGLRKTDFVPGSEIVVQGFLARNGRPIANGREITFADGRDFFLGSSGTGAPIDGAEKK